MQLRIGTRGSRLALAQTRWVADHLARLTPGLETELVVIDSQPNATRDHPELGDGIFVREIQLALKEGVVSMAVHSLKDLPTAPVPGLTVGAIPARADPRDCIVGGKLASLPKGARVGTSSPRRAAQLRRLRADVQVVPLTGNIPTRMEKLARGECDAAMLAAAGLARLGLQADDLLPLNTVLPAPGQGALAVEMRVGDAQVAGVLGKINHPPSGIAVKAERAVLSRLGGGCLLPVSALGAVAGGRLHLQARVVAEDGSRQIDAEGWGDPAEPETLAGEVAEKLILHGAWEVLESPA